MDIRLSGHGAHRTQYRVVWIPKYRRRILNPGLAAYLPRVFAKTLREMPGVGIDETNVRPDHVHAVTAVPPRYAVSAVTGRLKGQSSSALRKRFGWLEKVFWNENVVWSPGYFVSTVGIDEKRILAHVRYQQGQDSGQAKLVLK
ncbi:MAG: IS200/IS605 family transposase [bacterium]